MTASHLQTIPSGPVQLIGLPRSVSATAAAAAVRNNANSNIPNSNTNNINRMGVTNPRLSHRRLLINHNNNNNNNGNNINNNNNNNNGGLGISGAKRCLFGSPEPGEIQALYEEEMRRNHAHFIRRYNFDIYKERFVNNDQILNTNNNNNNNNNNNDVDNNSTNLNNINNEKDIKKLCENTKESCNNQNQLNENIEERLHEAHQDQQQQQQQQQYDNSNHDDETIIKKIIDNNDSCDVNCTKYNKNIISTNMCNDNNNITTTPKTSRSLKNFNDDDDDVHDDYDDETTITNLGPTAAAINITTTGLSPLTSIHKDKKSNERLKPYSRQHLLTDYYATRKVTTAIIVRQSPSAKPQTKNDVDEQTIINDDAILFKKPNDKINLNQRNLQQQQKTQQTNL